MLITEEQYNWLAEQSYWIEENRSDVRYHPEVEKTYYFDPDKPSLGQFQVLKVKDNTENGMQAMAVAPVDKNGKATCCDIVREVCSLA
ncbi:hypothetical protein [Streptococcus pluranimalium]